MAFDSWESVTTFVGFFSGREGSLLLDLPLLAKLQAAPRPDVGKAAKFPVIRDRVTKLPSAARIQKYQSPEANSAWRLARRVAASRIPGAGASDV